MSVELDFNKLSGVQKAAIVLMSISQDNASRIYQLLDDDEIKEISHAMTSLGTVEPDIIDHTIAQFTNQLSDTSSFVGNVESTERILARVLDDDRVSHIMEEIRGPAGRNTWDKLGNVSEDVLASYLKNEHPQTVALIVSKITPMHAARVLITLPEEFSFEVMQRMLEMDPVKKEVLDEIEKTLRAEFISNIAKTQKHDSYEMMADIVNNFDRANESKFMGMLETQSQDTAERIKNLMFTFEDLSKIDQAGIQQLLRNIDKSQLAIALKGANEEMRDLFVSNMSERAAKIMLEDIEAMGPVRLKEVDEAQMEIVTKAKEMSAKGELMIAAEADGEDELVY